MVRQLLPLLTPELRKEFRTVIHDVGMYDYQLEDYKATGQEIGWDADATKTKRKELDQTFKNIMIGMQDRIQTHIDIYYRYTE